MRKSIFVPISNRMCVRFVVYLLNSWRWPVFLLGEVSQSDLCKVTKQPLKKL